jgi:hypothetical protein
MKNRWIAGLVFPGALVMLSSMSGLTATAAGAQSRAAASTSASPPASLRIGDPVQNLRVRPGFGANSIPTVTSSNWSGYVDTNHTKEGAFRNIAATWNVPEIPNSACPSGNYGYRLAAVWVGLDGSGDSTVEQTGTLSQCHNGTLSYNIWYEMYPKAPVTIESVSPGDQISAYVDYTGKYWLLSIVDNTKGNGFSTLQSCPSGSTCHNWSAEAIAEAPGGCSASSSQVCNGTLYPLADYDFVSLHGVSVAAFNAGGGLGSSNFGPENVIMTAGATTLSTVTTPISKDAFIISWKAST